MKSKYAAALKEASAWAVISLGAGVCAAGLNLFLVPAKIAPGGFSGIATIFYHTVGTPVGMTVLALNIPLFALAYKRLGRIFAVRTLYAMLLYSLLADMIPVAAVSADGLLCAVFGGALLGLGTGLILLYGATTGGSDLLAKLISDRLKSVSVGKCLFAVDLVIIAASGIVFELESALYAVVGLFVMTKLLSLITEGFSHAKAFFIITFIPEKVSVAVMNRLGRGISRISGTGGYSGREVTLLLCVVERASEVVKLKDIVKAEDPAAFVLLWDTREVLGEGFRRL